MRGFSSLVLSSRLLPALPFSQRWRPGTGRGPPRLPAPLPPPLPHGEGVGWGTLWHPGPLPAPGLILPLQEG